jgi:hypothetical protein
LPIHLPLDHLVVGVPDLSSAIDEFRAQLGVAPRFGGRHEGLGTHNAILPLAGSRYVELIGADPRSERTSEHPRPFGLDHLRTTRLVTWAVRSHAIESDLEAARRQGYDPGRLLSLSRQEPDGELLRWKLSLRPEPFGDGLVPFVIDWGETRHPSEAAESEAGESAQCELHGFSGHHPDPVTLAKALTALGVELPLNIDPIPSLMAEIRGPSGSIRLG